MKKLLALIALISSCSMLPAPAQTNDPFAKFDVDWVLGIFTRPPIETLEAFRTNTLIQVGVGAQLDNVKQFAGHPSEPSNLKAHAIQDTAWKIVNFKVTKTVRSQLNFVDSTVFKDDGAINYIGAGTTIFHRKLFPTVVQATGALPTKPFHDWYLFCNGVVRTDHAFHGQFGSEDTEIHLGAGSGW